MVLRLADCAILHASDLPACTARIAKRFVGYATIQYVSRGRVELAYNRNAQVLVGPMVWPCNPGPFITFHPAPGTTSWHHHHIAVRGPLLDHWRSEGLWPHAPQPMPAQGDGDSLFKRMVACARDPARQLLAVNLLEQVLLILAEDRREPVAEAWVDRARRLLAEEGSYPVDVAAVAAEVSLAPSTFRRRFQAAVGLSPRDFALTARMGRARDLLLSSERSVADIAEALGYGDVAFFSKQFTRKTGLSPRAFRATRT